MNYSIKNSKKPKSNKLLLKKLTIKDMYLAIQD